MQMAEQLSGQRFYLDNSTLTYPVGLKVTPHPSDVTLAYIPVIVPGTDSLGFAGQLGLWTQVNTWTTAREIKAGSHITKLFLLVSELFKNGIRQRRLVPELDSQEAVGQSSMDISFVV